MSAAAVKLPRLELLLRLEQDKPVLIDPFDSCRFCGCTEEAPCAIAIAEDLDGTVRLARTAAETADVLACGWFLPRVCNSPNCIERLVMESRLLLFDAQGRSLKGEPVPVKKQTARIR
jgi:hypothetical protein